MRLRTDIADSGLYIFKYWTLKLLLGLEQDFDI